MIRRFTNIKMSKIMKYLLTILSVLSIGLFASCGGESESHEHNSSEECCGKCQDDANASDE